MSIQDLGSLGEFVAAIATLVTLIYLAMQIRHNTRALDQASENAVTDGARRWRENVIHHPEVAQLYLKGMLEPASLDRAEKLRFRMLLWELFELWQYQYKAGMFSLDAVSEDLNSTLDTPGGAAYWNKSKHRLSSEFVAYAEGLTQSGFDREQ